VVARKVTRSESTRATTEVGRRASSDDAVERGVRRLRTHSDKQFSAVVNEYLLTLKSRRSLCRPDEVNKEPNRQRTKEVRHEYEDCGDWWNWAYRFKSRRKAKGTEPRGC